MEISTRDPGVFAHRVVPLKEEMPDHPEGWEQTWLIPICVTESTPDPPLDPYQDLVFLPQSIEPIFINAVICNLQRVLM